jgi:hypothetical protein
VRSKPNSVSALGIAPDRIETVIAVAAVKNLE